MTTGARSGIAGAVGGKAETGGLAAVTALENTGVDVAVGTATAVELALAEPFNCCTSGAARSLSRRFRSSDTLSVAVCLETTFFGFGLAF